MALEDLPFQSIRESALRRIRLAEAPAAARRQQAINVAGVRTSGVGQLPLIQAARDRALAEAGIEESIAGAEAQQLGAERLTNLQHQLLLERMRRQFDLEDLAGQTAARRGLQGALVGAGLGLAGSALKKALIGGSPTAPRGPLG